MRNLGWNISQRRGLWKPDKCVCPFDERQDALRSPLQKLLVEQSDPASRPPNTANKPAATIPRAEQGTTTSSPDKGRLV